MGNQRNPDERTPLTHENERAERAQLRNTIVQREAELLDKDLSSERRSQIDTELTGLREQVANLTRQIGD